MIRRGSLADLESIRSLLVAANSTPYDVGRVAEEKCFAPGYWGEPHVEVFEDDGVLAGVSVTSGRFLRILAVDPARRRRGIGTALLRSVAKNARVVAAEPANYLTPGVITTDSASVAFYRARGYVATRWTWNLDADLGALPDADEAVARRVAAAERDRVLRFVEKTFGHVWRFECTRAFDADPPNAFLAEAEGEIVGFAVHDVNNLGLGFFGPTGVKSGFRRRGFGRNLLLASLADLRRLGHERAVIPWTESIDFYRQSCGAVVSGKFIAFAKKR